MGTGGAGSLVSDGPALSEGSDLSLLVLLALAVPLDLCSTGPACCGCELLVLWDSSRRCTPTLDSLWPTACSFLPHTLRHTWHGSQNSRVRILGDKKMYSTALPHPWPLSPTACMNGKLYSNSNCYYQCPYNQHLILRATSTTLLSRSTLKDSTAYIRTSKQPRMKKPRCMLFGMHPLLLVPETPNEKKNWTVPQILRNMNSRGMASSRFSTPPTSGTFTIWMLIRFRACEKETIEETMATQASKVQTASECKIWPY